MSQSRAPANVRPDTHDLRRRVSGRTGRWNVPPIPANTSRSFYWALPVQACDIASAGCALKPLGTGRCSSPLLDGWRWTNDPRNDETAHCLPRGVHRGSLLENICCLCEDGIRGTFVGVCTLPDCLVRLVTNQRALWGVVASIQYAALGMMTVLWVFVWMVCGTRSEVGSGNHCLCGGDRDLMGCVCCGSQYAPRRTKNMAVSDIYLRYTPPRKDGYTRGSKPVSSTGHNLCSCNSELKTSWRRLLLCCVRNYLFSDVVHEFVVVCGPAHSSSRLSG